MTDKLPINTRRLLLSIPQAEDKIREKLEDLLTAMMDLALGHFKYSSRFDKDTGQVETKVYEVEPDYKALAFLLENVLGKTPQRLELTGDGGGPVKIIPYMAMAEALRAGILTLSGPNDKETPETPPGEEVVDAEFNVLDSLRQEAEAPHGA